MQTAVARKERSGTTHLAARSRFGKYSSEAEQPVRTLHVKENPVLDNMKKLWSLVPHLQNERPSKYFKRLSNQELFKSLNCSAKDIEDFCIVLAEFQVEKEFFRKAGLFLSGLINNGSDENYIIHTDHLSVDLDLLGYRNTKNIAIRGNAGGWLGHMMEGGSITVNGNVDLYVGCEMEDGTIIVEGNGGDHVGAGMKGGSIRIKGNVGDWMASVMIGGAVIVEGNAGDRIGANMVGGEIHLLGDYGDIVEHVIQGKIYHKGKLIVEKEELFV